MIGIYFLTSVEESSDDKNQLVGNSILIGVSLMNLVPKAAKC